MIKHEVNIYNDNNYDLDLFVSKAKIILIETLKIINKSKQKYCVAIIFINEEKSLALNKTYRNKTYVADVLSFANGQTLISEQVIDVGDIFICYEKAKSQATIYNHGLLRELSFLFLHGLLHCFGYDHKEVAEEKIMFTIQKTILNNLNITRD